MGETDRAIPPLSCSDARWGCALPSCTGGSTAQCCTEQRTPQQTSACLSLSAPCASGRCNPSESQHTTRPEHCPLMRREVCTCHFSARKQKKQEMPTQPRLCAVLPVMNGTAGCSSRLQPSIHQQPAQGARSWGGTRRDQTPKYYEGKTAVGTQISH